MDLSHVQRVRALYKIIMKLHRGLPPELHVMGNMYAKEEFKRHKTCNTAEAAVFMSEWTKYAMDISKQLGLKGPKFSKQIGEDLDENLLDKMREDQIMQLYELYITATNKESNVNEATKSL